MRLILLIFLLSCVERVSAQRTDFDPNVNYEVEQINPVFPGGEEALNQYLNQRISGISADPQKDAKVVYIQFMVKEDGTVSNVQAMNYSAHSSVKSLVSAIQSMPKWTPGSRLGIPCGIYMVLTFNLPE